MIKESYIANWGNLPSVAYKVRVARPSILSPSKQLLDDYKQNKINWAEYEVRFRKEILTNPEAMKELKHLVTISQFKDVYLICYEKEYPCHRFILIDIINEIIKGNGGGGGDIKTSKKELKIQEKFQSLEEGEQMD